eukprot:gene12217-14306_t
MATNLNYIPRWDPETANQPWYSVDCTSHYINRVHPYQGALGKGHNNDSGFANITGLNDTVTENDLVVLGDLAYKSSVYVTPRMASYLATTQANFSMSVSEIRKELVERLGPKKGVAVWKSFDKRMAKIQSGIRSNVEIINANDKEWDVAEAKSPYSPEFHTFTMVVVMNLTNSRLLDQKETRETERVQHRLPVIEFPSLDYFNLSTPTNSDRITEIIE